MKNRNCDWRRRGLSLIELLIASTLMAAAGSLLTGGLLLANRNTARRTEQVLATHLLASRLALLEDELGAETPTSGLFPEPLDESSWNLQVATAEGPLAPLTKVTLTVKHQGVSTDVVTYRRQRATQ